MQREAVEKIYRERKSFIIIAMTGQTGSGCTTAAKLLCSDFDALNYMPEDSGFNQTDIKKNQIIYEYAKCNWNKFQLVEVKNIIMTFILEKNFDELKEYIIENDLADNISFSKDFKELYDAMHKDRKKYQEAVEIERKIFSEKALTTNDIHEYYFVKLTNVTSKFKSELEKNEAKLYTKLFQHFGRNIRLSGDAFKNTLVPEKVYTLSERINKLIKILRKRNIDNKEGVRVVIDALRNPLEILFFKDRYASFYTFSINTENEERRRRLRKKQLTDKEIDGIDKRENEEKIEGTEQFTAQNIPHCLQIADVHIINPKDEYEYDLKTNVLKGSLIKYVSLIMQPGLVTPTHVERSMNIAYNAKLNSGCISRQVGAVVTDKNYSIISVGWNSVPEGQVACNLRTLNDLNNLVETSDFSDFEKHNEEFRDYVKKKLQSINIESLKGRSCFYCFKDYYTEIIEQKNQVHTRSLHAEENAFLQISKYGGRPVQNGILFTTASPCELCAKKAYQLGIQTIYYIDPYPGITKPHILSAGKHSPNMKLYYGAIGNAYIKLYAPIMSIKDELNLLNE